jgi:hypothetical protein
LWADENWSILLFFTIIMGVMFVLMGLALDGGRYLTLFSSPPRRATPVQGPHPLPRRHCEARSAEAIQALLQSRLYKPGLLRASSSK